jgi:lysozyme
MIRPLVWITGVGAGVAAFFIVLRRVQASRYVSPTTATPHEPATPASVVSPPKTISRRSVSNLLPSQAIVEMIKQAERFEPKMYNDGGGHCTIGFGHLIHTGRCKGTEPAQFRTITYKQALVLLAKDMEERAAIWVRRFVKVPLHQHEFDALVSFQFNTSPGDVRTSTLMRELNQGNYAAVSPQMQRWVYSSGRRLAGLVKRRKAEGLLFSKGIYTRDIYG